MITIIITICSFVILLGFEIRHREIAEEVAKLKDATELLDAEVIKLKAEIKLKKNVYEDFKNPDITNP